MCSTHTQYGCGFLRGTLEQTPQLKPQLNSLCQTPYSHHVERTRCPGSRYLGLTTGCQQTLNSTCRTGEFNVSMCLHSTLGHLNASVLETHLMRWPDDSGAGSLVDYVWLCGDYWYQILPPLWTGGCALIYLTPSIKVMSSLVHTTHYYPQYIPPSGGFIRVKRKLTGQN